MVDSQYSKNNYKSPKISTGAIIKNPGMLKLFLIIFKLKRCVNMQLKITFQNQMCS